MIKKTLEEMSVMDNFLSNALATTPEVNERFYRLLLSVLLGKKLGQITVNAQRFLPGIAPDRRGIRLDVEITEENNGIITDIYDVEPHHRDHSDEYKHLPRRNRFYQAKIDSRVPKSGAALSNLHNLYVISILDYDLFGKDYMLYTVSNQCKEVPEAEYKDGLTFLYFYTKGTKGGSQQRTKSRSATLCALVRASEACIFICAPVALRSTSVVAKRVPPAHSNLAERFYFIGNSNFL